MIKIGITGQAGFIGTHLFNKFNLYKDKFETIPFEDGYFSNADLLAEWVKKCEIIVHLAALNRHNDPDVIYNTNISLVEKLIIACEETQSKPYILFSSSAQEVQNNMYGRSKIEGRKLFERWAEKESTRFTGLIIPNVYGPFGNPFHNSVVSTFCYQLTHGQTPMVEIDNNLKLIYIDELVNKIVDHIVLALEKNTNDVLVEHINFEHTSEIKVIQLLNLLQEFKSEYFEKGIIPPLDTPLKKNLFITFLCFIDHTSFFPFPQKTNIDERGSFTELFKLNSGGQVSFSTTTLNSTRGNHFHTRKVERFVVVKGKALIEFRMIGTDKVFSFELDGRNPSFVDIPIWHTHNIKNIGTEELYTIFWINEFFDQNDPDTFYEKV